MKGQGAGEADFIGRHCISYLLSVDSGIYFFDPTSNCRLELTTPLARLSDQDAANAEKALDQWEAWREEATDSGLAFADFLRQKLQMRAKHVA